MPQNRWLHQGPWRPAGADRGPSLPSLEAVYLTDARQLAAVLPPPLDPPAEPRMHVRITRIDLEIPGGGRYQEMVGFFAAECSYNGQAGEYPLVIPIDLEPAVAVSRERFGEPKVLAEIDLGRSGQHVEGRINRQGVTIIEMAGEVAETLPTPSPYEARQFWFKYLPAVDGSGFDAGPLLVQVDQVRTPEAVERVDGKLSLGDLASTPVADLPVEDLVSLVWTVRHSSHHPRVVANVDAVGFAPFAAARYDHV
jgi:acetoacetate decarboxylase